MFNVDSTAVTEDNRFRTVRLLGLRKACKVTFYALHILINFLTICLTFLSILATVRYTVLFSEQTFVHIIQQNAFFNPETGWTAWLYAPEPRGKLTGTLDWIRRRATEK